jgi:2-methylcitrate dehydratase
MVAAALLDGQVMPEQYEPGRIPREDVQSLLRKIVVKPDEALTARFPREMPCRLEVRLRDGTLFGLEKEAYEGFHTNPMTWDGAVRKFERLSSPRLDESRRRAIVDCVASMESHGVEDLTGLLT